MIVKNMQGWGCYPKIDSQSVQFNNLKSFSSNSLPFIPSGNLRSYGDAALESFHLSMLPNNRFISFDYNSGLLTCESGVLLSEIIDIFVPQGWFLSVSPGTKEITVGGAIASDVHGKNHHIAGCFSESIDSFELIVPGNAMYTCSRLENEDLFHATCGGMGLTGIITKVSFYLKRVSSKWINQITVKTNNLQETFHAFEHYKSSTYSVAWIDCMAKSTSVGRSLINLGEFSKDGDLSYTKNNTINIPFIFPSITLNKLSVKAFNTLYYSKAKQGVSTQKVGINNFFYPLDSISHWNRIYGKNGFIQFQFILPLSASFEGLSAILNEISRSGMGSFLAVLKLYGSENKNWLSFPLEGYSLALDFKIQTGLKKFIHRLTEIVIELGGRVYLAKDALLTHDQFDRSYPRADDFRRLRSDMGLDAQIQSLLSKRLGI